MNGLILLMLAAILSGYMLTKIPLEGTFLAVIAPITSTIGILAIVVFSLFLIFKGVMALLGK